MKKIVISLLLIVTVSAASAQESDQVSLLTNKKWHPVTVEYLGDFEELESDETEGYLIFLESGKVEMVIDDERESAQWNYKNGTIYMYQEDEDTVKLQIKQLDHKKLTCYSEGDNETYYFERGE